MDFARRRTPAFSGAMAFPNDGCAVRLYGDAHPGGIDRQESSPIFAGEDGTGFNRLPTPAVEPEDPVGLRDGVPAFQIRKSAERRNESPGTTPRVP